MIKIIQYPPPRNYLADVKIPGQNFLSHNPNPTSAEFKGHEYWKNIHDEMYNMYQGICAYCASWTPRKTTSTNNNQTSVDHFLPKSKYKPLAYEWDNFRLCRVRLNCNKDDSTDIVDPYFIQNGWFTLDFTSFQVLPNPHLPILLKSRISTTINILGLNDNDYVEQRFDIIYDYSSDNTTFVGLQQLYPFIAFEMQRQNFDENYKEDIRLLGR